MKQCPYCGRQHSDAAELCEIDGELLTAGAPTATSVPSTSVATTAPAAPQPHAFTDRQFRFMELGLVCLLAFGGSILVSTCDLFHVDYGHTNITAWGWAIQFLHEISVLALLWYLLLRRGKSFADLGLVWAWRDLGWFVLLKVVTGTAYYLIYYVLYYCLPGDTDSLATASRHTGNLLFGGGVNFMTLAFAFLNPFYEELVARAFVMTEIKELTNSTTLAIVISTALQTSYHFYQGVPAALSLGAVFLVFSLFYAKTKRLTPVILAHQYDDIRSTVYYMFR